MTALPMLFGATGDANGEFVESLPLNLEPVAVDNKIAKGQYRAPAGATLLGTVPDLDRGGIVWNDQLFRAIGAQLYKVMADGSTIALGAIASDGLPVTMDYGFDRLGINSAGKLYYYNGNALSQVTDQDLGNVIDMVWMDGYWVCTDGKYLVVTELSDPTSVLPLKYGSAEEDPDMITGVLKYNEELYALGRNTIQPFRNMGGNGFPFRPQPGATIPYGCVSASAKAMFANSFAFVGGGRNQTLGVYMLDGGTVQKISTRAVDDVLATVVDPASIQVEARTYRDEQRLLVHLPDQTLVYLLNATAVFQRPTWYLAQSGNGAPYRIRNAVFAYGRHYVGDASANALGILNESVSTHFGEEAEWQFDIGPVYNDANGGILHSIELVGLPGRGEGNGAAAFFSFTRDGLTYSNERRAAMGRPGQRGHRLQWRPHTMFRTMLGMRFRGRNAAMQSFAACNIEVESLSV